MQQSNIPHLSKRAFWSGFVPTDQSFFTEKKDAVIKNIFENGTYDDMIELLVYYGRENVIDSLKQAVPLNRSTLNLCCAIFNIPPTEFQCYIKNRLTPF